MEWEGIDVPQNKSSNPKRNIMELLYDDLSKKELYLIQQSKVPT
jgi:hypothetical protein